MTLNQLSDLPNDCVQHIASMLAVCDIYRDKYDVARDAAALYATSKTCQETRRIAKLLLEPLAQIGGFDTQHKGDIKTMQVRELKELCKLMKLSTCGTKATLTERLNARYAKRFTLIQDQAVIENLFKIRHRLVSIHAAKHMYGLTEKDLLTLRGIARESGGTAYKQRDIREISMKKYHDVWGLRAHLDIIESLRRERQKQKEERIQARTRILISALESVGCVNGPVINEVLQSNRNCVDFISSGKGLAVPIATEIAELRFLKQYTNFYDIVDVDENDGPHDISDASLVLYAKRIALKTWAHTFPNKSSALESSILPRSLKSMMEKWPRYMWKTT